MSQSFGSYVRSLRQSAHLSQRALAERLGVSHAYVAQVETGRRGPLLPSRWGALLAIGADIDELRRLAVAESVAGLLHQIDTLQGSGTLHNGV